MRVCVVLCVFFSVAFAAEQNARCKTPIGEYGTCVPVNSCAVIKEAIKYLDQDAIDFARRSQCGYENGPLVCCGSVGSSATEQPDVTVFPTRRTVASSNEQETIPLNRNSRCVTPNKENGSCVPLQSCVPIIRAMAHFDVVEFIKKSNCGNDKLNPLVCCGSVGQFTLPRRTIPSATIPPQSSLPNLKENSPCFTPNGENGSCISIRSCNSLLQSIESYDQDAQDFARRSQCAPGYENNPLVCCKTEKTNLPDLKPNSPCVTPNKKPGTCIPVNSCQSIQQIIARSDHKSKEFALKSQCGYEKNPLVCCPSNGQGSFNQQPSSGIPENSSCFTPNHEKGRCIPVNSCAPIKGAIEYLEPDAIEFARASQCGYENSPLVCCGSVGRFTQAQPSTLQVLPLLNTHNASVRNETFPSRGNFPVTPLKRVDLPGPGRNKILPSANRVPGKLIRHVVVSSPQARNTHIANPLSVPHNFGEKKDEIDAAKIDAEETNTQWFKNIVQNVTSCQDNMYICLYVLKYQPGLYGN